MSKFDYDAFTGEYPVVVSMERYTKHEAIEIAKRELGVDEVEMAEGYVRYGYGVDDDPSASPRNTWWLSIPGMRGDCPKRYCPVWAFREKRKECK